MSLSLKSLRVGVVGCGENSDNHLRVYSALKGVRLAAVYDTTIARARAKAIKYAAEEVPRDYDSMLGLKLDLIDIVTPTQTHVELSKLALESGSNVLVEKPMAVTSEECQLMIEAARKNGRTLCVTHNKIFYESLRSMKATLERKGLAPVRADLISFYANARAREGSSWILTEAHGGILWEIAVHDIYLSEYILGPTKRVYAVGNRVNQPQPDSITMLLQSDDAVAVCQTEWNVVQPAEKLQVVTREGDRFITDFYHDAVIRRSRVPRAGETCVMSRFYEDFHDPLANWSKHLRDLIKWRSYQMARPSQRTFFVLIQELVSYLNGENDLLPTRPEDGLKAVRVLEAAKRSIETGTTQSTQ